jgi:hypothetical protein
VKELRNKHSNMNAVVIFGGASIICNKYDLSLLSDNDDIVFLESKALTPEFQKFNIKPDYYFMPYPEKIKTNSLQHVFIQAISSGFKLEKVIKNKYINEWNNFKDKFDQYAKIWRIEYPHKRYRINNKVLLEKSPISFLKNFPDMSLITYDKAYDKDNFKDTGFPNKVYKYTHSKDQTNDINKYLNPKVVKGRLTLSNMGFVNSAAISMYPILEYMGFKKVILVGMDMSMLGSMEFSAPFTFRSMKHYGKFFNASRQTFSHKFPRGLYKGLLYFFYAFLKDLISFNVKKILSSKKYSRLYKDVFGLGGRFMREKDQVKDAGEIFINSGMEFINIYEPSKFTLPIPKIKNISYSEYFKNKVRI